jgi:hypothetical protein
MMKKTILSIAIVFMFVLGVNAQSELPNVLKINPIGLAFGNFNLNYQRGLTDATAIQIGANYWYKIFGEDVSGVGIRGSYQFFITNKVKPAPEGFYIGPQVSYNSIKDKDSQESVNAFGVGLMLGYQWIWASGVTLDLGAGPMYQFADETSTGISYEGFLPNITIAIGYNF